MRTATPGGNTPADFKTLTIPQLYRDSGKPEIVLCGEKLSTAVTIRDNFGNSSYHLFLSPENARELADMLHIAAAAAEARDAAKK